MEIQNKDENTMCSPTERKKKPCTRKKKKININTTKKSVVPRVSAIESTYFHIKKRDYENLYGIWN